MPNASVFTPLKILNILHCLYQQIPKSKNALRIESPAYSICKVDANANRMFSVSVCRMFQGRESSFKVHVILNINLDEFRERQTIPTPLSKRDSFMIQFPPLVEDTLLFDQL